MGRFVMVAAGGMVCLMVLAEACGRTTLPSRLTSSQHELLSESYFTGITVGVERFHYPVYSDRLLIGLRGTHLFGRVDMIDAFLLPPTFVARVERPVHGAAVLPLVPTLTLGLVPITVDEEYGYAFSLNRRAASLKAHVPVEFIYHDAAVFGWRGLVVNLSKDGTMGDVYRHPRLHEALAWTIVQHRQEICAHAPEECDTPAP